MAIAEKHTELNAKGPILCSFAPKEINNNTEKQVKGVIFISFVQAQITNSNWNKKRIHFSSNRYIYI